MAAPSVLTTVYPDRQGVNDILGEAGVNRRLDDNQSGAVASAEEAMLTRLYSEATAWVKYYLVKYDLSDYPTDDNAGHWLVYRWACIRAAFQLCRRRGNPVPGTLDAMHAEALETLKAIQSGEETLADVAQVASPSLSLSNLRLDGRYHSKQLRVIGTTSDTIPAKHDQSEDYVSKIIPELIP